MKSKSYSSINIIGLAMGMAVTMLIGLWIWDEISFDRYNKNYDRIAQIMQNIKLNGGIVTWGSVPYPLGAELRRNFSSDFKQVIVTSRTNSILSYGEKKFSKKGIYMDPGAPEMLDLKMIRGSRSGITEPNSILLSASLAKAYFGEADPMGKVMKIDTTNVQVTGIYQDLPQNSAFTDANFLVSWQLLYNTEKWIKEMANPWGSNFVQVFVQLNDHVDMNTASIKIRDVKLNNVHKNEINAHPQLFLNPMRNWHLYGEFENGINAGGRIKFVWLFGAIGVFVLLLACINFMNLSTARSGKRAKEVGIRKTVGSLRSQLIWQFLSESIVVAFLAFIISMAFVLLSLPFFNELADKKISVPWSNSLFWMMALSFTLFTGFIAGSYPAFYLSGFKPVRVLKGIFKAGRFASLPRKILVVLQFTVCIILIIGTLIVFRQIQFAKNRPIGYNKSGLIVTDMHTRNVHDHLDAVRNELKNSGAIIEMAETANPVTAVWSTNGGLSWKGKDPGVSSDFPVPNVSYEFGKTVGWQIIAGRDFSREMAATDSSAFILNESAVKYMGLKNPIGETITYNDGVGFKVIGVIKDFIMESPYAPVRPSLFRIARNGGSVIIMRINPLMSTREALNKIETVFRKYNPDQPFDYKFVDEEYAIKFSDEERIGNLASVFAIFAIFISCIGLFGLASFVAEQRTKEIGVRKVLGASVFNVWHLLSKDFIRLVIISFLIATPTAYYFMHAWLQNYAYRTGLSWWIFAATGMGILLITLLTVSYQSIKAALMNPAKSLKAE